MNKILWLSSLLLTSTLFGGEFEKNQKACTKGDSNACFEVAIHYSAKKKDNKKMMEFFSKACDLGDVESCKTSAKTYLLGKYKVAKNADKAIEFYDKACSLKHLKSCRLLAHLYDEQRHPKALRKFGKIKKDEKKSISYYDKLCKYDKKNITKICTILGMRFEDGDGFKKDTKKALELYSIGCKKGDANACELLGESYKEGLTGKVDKKKAIKWLKKACDLGNKSACSEHKTLLK